MVIDGKKKKKKQPSLRHKALYIIILLSRMSPEQSE